MNKQVIRIYIFITLIVVVLLFLADSAYDMLNDEASKYQIPVSTLIQLEKNKQRPLLSKVELSSFHLPEELRNEVENGEIIAIKTNDNAIVFLQKENEQLMSYGPFYGLDPKTSHLADSIELFFFVFLALAFLVLLFPIARDINKVQTAARAFSEKPTAIVFNIDKGSIIYPIAQSMATMSARIVELINMKQDLANTVAHEIRTPLSRLKFVQKQVEGAISDKNNARILKDIEEINSLVSDYLTLSKLDDQGSNVRLSRQSLSNLSESIADKFDVYSTQFNINIDCEDINVTYDLRMMTIATQNLLMNALRYANEKIEVEIGTIDGHCFVRVRDDGKGVSSKRESLIEQFNRKAHHKTDYGFGLGLYIVDLISKKHQGELLIHNDSELGGASFEIRWPDLE